MIAVTDGRNDDASGRMTERDVRVQPGRIVGDLLRHETADPVENALEVLRCEFAFIIPHGCIQTSQVERIEGLFATRSVPIGKGADEASDRISRVEAALVVVRRRQAATRPFQKRMT